MEGVEDDGSLAEDMSTVEALLGPNVVLMVKDNLILDLLRTYSTDKNRVQRVFDELQKNHLKENDLSFLMDEADDELLALDSPCLPESRLTSNNPVPIAQSGQVTSKGNPTSANGEVSSPSSSSTSSASHEPQGARGPVLQPAKFNVAADQWNPTNMMERQKPGTISSSSPDDSSAGSFKNHRDASFSKSDDSSGSSTNSDSEPEVISIHDDDRKRRKMSGNKSPGKKTKVEVVDLVTSSPNTGLNCNEYFGIIQAMFPDADPVYLRQKFKHIDDEHELNAVAAAMLEANNYPRIVAGGTNIQDQGLERPSTSSTHNASVILKPSVFQVQDTNKPQPSTSTVPGNSADIVQPKEIDENEIPLLTPEEVIAIASAIEAAPISVNVPSLPQPPGTLLDVPNSTAAVVQPHLPANQVLAPRNGTASLPEGTSTTTASTPGPLIPSTQTVPPYPNQAVLVPPTHLQPKVINPFTNSLPQEIVPLPPGNLAPPTIVKQEQPSVASGTNGLRDATEAGPSGTGFTKEEPWSEKHLLLLCLLPQSDPKFLEEKARQLYNKDEEFKLFVETSLEALYNPPPNDEPRVTGQVIAQPIVRINKVVSSDVGSKTGNAQNAMLANLPKKKEANVQGSSSAKATGSSRTVTAIPSTKTSGVAQLPAATGANLPAPSGVNLPGPSAANLPGPSGVNLPGPSGVNLPGPSGVNLPGPSGVNLPGPTGVDPAVPGPSDLNNGDGDATPWSHQHSFLLSILPEADPTFLEEKAKLLYDKDEEMKTFVANALENKDYPTLKDYQRRQELVALQNKYLKDFNIENFLDIVPEPFKYFSQSTRKPSVDDQNRGLLFLKRKYRLVRSNDIAAVYRKNNCNLTNTCHELDQFKGVPLKSRRSDFQTWEKISDTTLTLQFLQEVAFIENEAKIKKYLKDKEDEEVRALKEAQEKGELLECNCCFDDEVLARNIVACPEGHVFCKSCVRKGAETKIGEGINKVSCLTDCQAEFTLQALQSVLKPTVFSKLAQRKQLEEIKAAGIEDLIQCPFCDFCNIPGAGDKIFRCLNPDCMKNSCIMCKEESHIPLRCDEVEKATEVKMRTYIEDKMTEALVRQCWKCQRKFVKIDGCNKMTCQCGALMCYICRQPVKDYSHFNGQGGEDFDKCPLFSDNNALHVDAVEKVAAEAKAELAQKHPGITLRHDPTAVPIARDARRTMHAAQLAMAAAGYGNRGNHPYGYPPRLYPPIPVPAPVQIIHAPQIRIPIPAAPIPQIPQIQHPRIGGAYDYGGLHNRYRPQPQADPHNRHHHRAPHQYYVQPPVARPAYPRDGGRDAAAMDLPELREFAADVLAGLQRDAYQANMRPAGNRPAPPYNVNVPAPNENAYYAQDMRVPPEFQHRPN